MTLVITTAKRLCQSILDTISFFIRKPLCYANPVPVCASKPAEQAFSIGTYQSRPKGLDWCVYKRSPTTHSRAALAVLQKIWEYDLGLLK